MNIEEHIRKRKYEEIDHVINDGGENKKLDKKRRCLYLRELTGLDKVNISHTLGAPATSKRGVLPGSTRKKIHSTLLII